MSRLTSFSTRLYSGVDLKTIERELKIGTGTSQFLAQCFDNLDEMRRYLEPEVSNLHSPELLSNIDHLTDLTLLALDNGEGIFVWGHDDVDGHTATAIMVKTLRLLNGRVDYHIPDKQKEGYLIPEELIEKIKSEGFTTIITADFGSSSPLNLKRCRKAGIKLLVTDHHEVLYNEGVQVNPKFPNSRYPENNLSGAAVSMKVAQYLATNILDISIEEFYALNPDLLILAFLGSVADRMDLFGENRTIILLGLKEFNRSKSGWVRTLQDENAGNYPQIIHKIIPLLGSARGDSAVKFYHCEDYEEALLYIKKFKESQKTWRNGFARFLPMVLKSVKLYPNLSLAIVPGLPLEFLGSFANRLKDEFSRNSIVVTRRNGDWMAEMRGLGSIDLVEKLLPMKGCLTDFGGHPLACGLSFPDRFFDVVIPRIIEILKDLSTVKSEKKTIRLKISTIDDSMKKIFPLSRDIIFFSPRTEVNGGRVCNRKVVWNVTPPVDGIYDLSYTLDEDLNIYIREVRCPP